MNVELVVWYDNRSGITHICKRNDVPAHLTPLSAADDEKNLIKEMCRQTAVAYGGNNVDVVKSELQILLAELEKYQEEATHDDVIKAYSRAIIGIQYILEDRKL